MYCESCKCWITSRVTRYGDGSEVINERAADGKGKCTLLGVEVPADFGCLQYEAGDKHVVIMTKPGEPWHHWTDGPCPDCDGKGCRGDSACYRCIGTGKVRYYDDGHVGQERHPRHPKDVVAPPKCASCGYQLDHSWVACPKCGWKTDTKVPTTEVVPNNIRTGALSGPS